jgi:PAS domain-containing protein
MRYHNAEALTRMQQQMTLLSRAMEASGQGVIVLTKDGHVQLISPRAGARR